MELLVRKKLHGGALYIAIIVGVIISIMLAMFIMLAKSNQSRVTIFAQSSQLRCNLISASEICQSKYFGAQENNKWFKNNFNDDSIKIKKIYWGAYLLINSKTKNRHHLLSSSGLYGTWMSSDTGLVTVDRGRPIGVAGNVIFKANCYFPSPGIKPAFIEGQSYQGLSQNNSFIKTTSAVLKELDNNFIKGIHSQLEYESTNNDSVVFSLPEYLDQRFDHKTVVWQTNVRQMGGLNLKNNIIVISKQELVLDSTNHFENILIICKKIKFKKGFKGSIHVIASDSIVTERNCLFNYPSSFVLDVGVEKRNYLGYIHLDENCIFFGGIVGFGEDPNENAQKIFIKLNAKSEVNGFIYSSNYLHVEGKLNANVFCNKLLLRTVSAAYEDHLMSCEIDPSKYSHVESIPMVFNKKSKLIKCLDLDL